LLILLVAAPMLTIPLFRGPPLYRWRVQRKLFKRYRQSRRIEPAARTEDADRVGSVAELDRLQQELGAIRIPLAHAEDLYHLRRHIDGGARS
jgi:hypothetical protein